MHQYANPPAQVKRSLDRFSQWQAQQITMKNEREKAIEKVSAELSEYEQQVFKRLLEVDSDHVLSHGVRWVLTHKLTIQDVRDLIRDLQGAHKDNAHSLTNILGFNLQHPEL